MSEKEEYYRRRIEKESKREKQRAERLLNRIKEPAFVIQFLLVLCTIGLIAVGYLQVRVLKTTDQTLKDTLSANRASQRASVYLKNIDRQIGPGTDGKPVLIYTANWANGGTTETRGLKVWSVCDPGEPQYLGPDFKKFMAQHPEALTQDSIGPNAVHAVWTCAASAESIIQQIYRNGWFVYGRATYQDVFSASHVTEFCYQARFTTATVEGITLSTCSGAAAKHNCTDDECEK
jgi:hypothetical protein